MRAAIYARYSTDKQSEHSIDDQHVVIAFARASITIKAVGGVVGDVPLLAKRLHEIGGALRIVFNDEKSHIRHITFPE